MDAVSVCTDVYCLELPGERLRFEVQGSEEWGLVRAALSACIFDHGPITDRYLDSAVQRVLSALSLGEIEKISPRTALQLVGMLNIKYPRYIERATAAVAGPVLEEAARLKRQAADLRRKLVAAESRVKRLGKYVREEEPDWREFAADRSARLADMWAAAEAREIVRSFFLSWVYSASGELAEAA